MKQRLRFTVDIDAPRAQVWDTMLAPDSYQAWTAAFCEGSTYNGSWELSAKIRFLGPGGDGMVAEIAERRTGEYLSIRHLGDIRAGVEDTDSDAVRAWAPAYENYRFSDRPSGGTALVVELDTVPAYLQFMQDTYPKALQRLKALCEAREGGAANPA